MVTLDFVKLPSDKRIGVWGGPTSGATGIQNVAVPTAAEINGPASAMIPFAQSLSWNDTELPGVTDSEEINEPSYADDAQYVEFGPTNYGGTLSMFRPREYDDASNPHSLVYDLTDLQDLQGDLLDFVVRIDGDKDALAAAANGDYVSVSRQRTQTESETYNFDESARRTVGLSGTGGFAHYTIVGPHTLTVETDMTTKSVGDKGRILVSVQGRDYTSALRFSTSTPTKVKVSDRGGFYEILDSGAFEILVEDVDAGTSTTISETAS